MARAAVPGRLTWRVATVRETSDETATARTLTLDIPGWPGHRPGQHVAVKPRQLAIRILRKSPPAFPGTVPVLARPRYPTILRLDRVVTLWRGSMSIPGANCGC